MLDDDEAYILVFLNFGKYYLLLLLLSLDLLLLKLVVTVQQERIDCCFLVYMKSHKK